MEFRRPIGGCPGVACGEIDMPPYPVPAHPENKAQPFESPISSSLCAGIPCLIALLTDTALFTD